MKDEFIQVVSVIIVDFIYLKIANIINLVSTPFIDSRFMLKIVL